LQYFKQTHRNSKCIHRFPTKVCEKGLQFIWITDGRGWKEMKNTIIQSSKEIDFLMNYTIANEKLAKIIPLLL
jgi:type II restriction enzyme